MIRKSSIKSSAASSAVITPDKKTALPGSNGNKNQLQVRPRGVKAARSHSRSYSMSLSISESDLGLTPEEIRICQHVYNESGGVSRTNLKEILHGMNVEVSEDEISQALQSVSQSASAYYIDLDTFTSVVGELKHTLWNTQYQQKDCDLVEAFVAMGGNPDRTGHVSAEVLLHAIHEFNLNLDVERFMALYDQDHNGTLEYSEFAALLKDHTEEEEEESRSSKGQSAEDMGDLSKTDPLAEKVARINSGARLTTLNRKFKGASFRRRSKQSISGASTHFTSTPGGRRVSQGTQLQQRRTSANHGASKTAILVTPSGHSPAAPQGSPGTGETSSCPPNGTPPADIPPVLASANGQPAASAGSFGASTSAHLSETTKDSSSKTPPGGGSTVVVTEGSKTSLSSNAHLSAPVSDSPLLSLASSSSPPSPSSGQVASLTMSQLLESSAKRKSGASSSRNQRVNRFSPRGKRPAPSQLSPRGSPRPPKIAESGSPISNTRKQQLVPRPPPKSSDSGAKAAVKTSGIVVPPRPAHTPEASPLLPYIHRVQQLKVEKMRLDALGGGYCPVPPSSQRGLLPDLKAAEQTRNSGGLKATSGIITVDEDGHPLPQVPNPSPRAQPPPSPTTLTRSAYSAPVSRSSETKMSATNPFDSVENSKLIHFIMANPNGIKGLLASSLKSTKLAASDDILNTVPFTPYEIVQMPSTLALSTQSLKTFLESSTKSASAASSPTKNRSKKGSQSRRRRWKLTWNRPQSLARGYPDIAPSRDHPRSVIMKPQVTQVAPHPPSPTTQAEAPPNKRADHSPGPAAPLRHWIPGPAPRPLDPRRFGVPTSPNTNARDPSPVIKNPKEASADENPARKFSPRKPKRPVMMEASVQTDGVLTDGSLNDNSLTSPKIKRTPTKPPVPLVVQVRKVHQGVQADLTPKPKPVYRALKPKLTTTEVQTTQVVTKGKSIQTTAVEFATTEVQTSMEDQKPEENARRDANDGATPLDELEELAAEMGNDTPEERKGDFDGGEEIPIDECEIPPPRVERVDQECQTDFESFAFRPPSSRMSHRSTPPSSSHGPRPLSSRAQLRRALLANSPSMPSVHPWSPSPVFYLQSWTALNDAAIVIQNAFRLIVAKRKRVAILDSRRQHRQSMISHDAASTIQRFWLRASHRRRISRRATPLNHSDVTLPTTVPSACPSPSKSVPAQGDTPSGSATAPIAVSSPQKGGPPKLIVTLLRAEDLPFTKDHMHSDELGLCRVYVAMRIHDEIREVNTFTEPGVDPVWNANFEFPMDKLVQQPASEVEHRTSLLHVLVAIPPPSGQRRTTLVVVGQGAIQLSNLLTNYTTSVTLPLLIKDSETGKWAAPNGCNSRLRIQLRAIGFGRRLLDNQ